MGYPNGLVGANPFPIPPDYYRFFVLKYVSGPMWRNIRMTEISNSDTSFTMEQLNDTVIRLGETINPGTMDVSEMDQSLEERLLIPFPRL